MPKQIVYQLMQNAVNYLQLGGRLPGSLGQAANINNIELNKLRVVPLLHPSQPCCFYAFEKHYKSIQVGDI